MEFGLLKTKIEVKLNEAYSKNEFKKEMKNFKRFVMENNELNRMYYIYDELSKEKGFDKEFAEDYLSECIDLYGRIKVDKNSIMVLENWLHDIVCENQYVDIDVALGKNTVIIENIINSKRNIISKLISKKEVKESVNISMDSLYNVAESTLKDYLSELNESDLSKLNTYLTLSESELKSKYDILSELAVDKLEKLKTGSDSETAQKIDETISKIKTDNVNSISLLKLKSLNENL
jgi:hypothetical protein